MADELDGLEGYEEAVSRAMCNGMGHHDFPCWSCQSRSSSVVLALAEPLRDSQRLRLVLNEMAPVLPKYDDALKRIEVLKAALLSVLPGCRCWDNPDPDLERPCDACRKAEQALNTKATP